MRRWRVIYKEEVGVFRASHFEAEDECALWDMIEASNFVSYGVMALCLLFILMIGLCPTLP